MRLIGVYNNPLGSWSAKHGSCPAGDPELHHYVGELLYKGLPLLLFLPHILIQSVDGAFEAAEPHLLSSNKRDSARLLAEMFIEWSAEDPSSHGAFALRGTLPCVIRIFMYPFT